MKLSKKIIAVFLIGMLIMALLSVGNNVIIASLMSSGEKTVKADVDAGIAANVDASLRELVGTISGFELSFERAIDNQMWAAANLLKEKDADSGYTLTNEDLEALLSLTGMSDMYLAGTDGVFTQTTEEAGIGTCLFDIWDGYRMLVTGESNYLPSTMKIKAETGEIFKFTSIPRKDGHGVVESALNADSIQSDLQQLITASNGIRAMHFIDPLTTVLTENYGAGGSSRFTKGANTSDENVAEIISGVNTSSADVEKVINGANSSGENATVSISDAQGIKINYIDGNTAEVFAPVMENGSLKYVLFLDVCLDSYYAVTGIIDRPFQAMISKVLGAGTTLAVILVVAAVLTLVIATLVTLKIFKPIGGIVNMASEMSEGNLEAPNIEAGGNDEIETAAKALNSMKAELSTYVSDISRVLKKMSDGDFREKGSAAFKGDFAAIGRSLELISSSLSTMIRSIGESARRVHDGTSAISVSSQHVADNAAGQVAEVNMLTGQIRDISEKIEHNASEAANALDRSEAVGGKLNEQNQAMQEMTAAMHEIKRCSDEIGAVIKAIEDIAFQTNILALNAAVEAARAGAAGKGFAVVADEVRNLANKSQEAAKSTGALIEQTIKAVNAGVTTAGSVAESMNEILSLSSQTSTALRSISAATESQSGAVHEIRGSIENISAVIAANSQAAVESAERSTELREQADELNAQIAGFQA